MKDRILEEYGKGNIVVATIDELQVIPIKEFIKQHVNGMLYDLNRNESTILSFVDEDPKWINDYATCKIIRLLKERINELEKQIKQ
jgi:hypothetical protein